jgi:alpha-amylase/alpha-mannosidase (GH57 family)
VVFPNFTSFAVIIADKMTALVIHGHFYQPPRENPWTDEVPVEPSAAPYHDWNERIHSECYGPNAFAHLGDKVVNNYQNISFNFGPTLLSWLAKHQSRTYQRILEADRESAALRSGHGNAIAQAYGHAILPLCNQKDRLTQILWGLEDFRYRFQREPESLWLPETACNDATMSLLIEAGLRYVILAPDQAGRVRGQSRDKWIDIGPGEIDTSQAYRYNHKDGSGRSIAVFFYHGGLARAIAFERALTSSRGLVDRFVHAGQGSRLVNVATDGETYGHHFKFGDLCLAHALEIEAKQAGFWITNYGESLDHHAPEFEVELNLGPLGEGSSWSCAHGVGRWIRDCGCHTGGEDGWNQAWRGPLRAALDFLRDDAAEHFEVAGSALFRDVWAARNDYVRVLLNHDYWSEFLKHHQRHLLTTGEEERARALLEVQKNALLMFTSCGWFFSDLAGIETIQILRYAARLIELQDGLGFESRKRRFLEMLAEARSNNSEKGNGAEIFARFAMSDEVPSAVS